MVVFRENTEDIYAGIEWQSGTPEAKKVIDFLQNEMGVKKIRFPETSAIGSQAGFQRGKRAPDPRRDPVCSRQQPQERDAGP